MKVIRNRAGQSHIPEPATTHQKRAAQNGIDRYSSCVIRHHQ